MSDAESDAAMGSGVESELESVSSQQPDVEERLKSLHELDLQITGILDRGSAVVEAIAASKRQSGATGSKENHKQQFESALKDYNSVVEDVNLRLRTEVKMLHEALRSQLLPLNIPVQGSEFGREKEDMIFKSLQDDS